MIPDGGTPPHNVEAEAAVLGAVLRNNEAIQKIELLLNAKDFYSDSHQHIFHAMLDLNDLGEPIDLLTLQERLRRCNTLEVAGGATYLSKLIDSTPTAGNVLHHAKIVREKSIFRCVRHIGLKLSNQACEAHSNSAEIIETALRTLENLRQQALTCSNGIGADDGWLVEDLLDFIKRPMPDEEPIIERGILARKGLMFISGPAKQGKSTFVLNLALCLATGTTFLERFRIPRARKVLYVQAEISEAPLQERLNVLLGDEHAPKPKPNYLSLLSRRDIELDDSRDLSALSRIVEKLKPEIVILDPLYKFHRGDENSAGDMKSLVKGIDQIIQCYDVAFILLHHHGKPTEIKRRGPHLMRGSSVLFDVGDTYLTLTPYGREEERRTRLHFELRNAAPLESLVLEQTSSLWVRAMDAPKAGQPKFTLTDLRDVFASKSREMLRGDVLAIAQEQYGVSESTVKGVLKEAIERGLVESTTVKSARGAPKMLIWRGHDLPKPLEKEDDSAPF